jgi:phosphonate transport system substrate-binding protein
MQKPHPWRAIVVGIALAVLPTLLPPQTQPGPRLTEPAVAKDLVLRIGAIPDQNPERLNRLYGLVAAELSRQLGVRVKYVPVIDYTAAVSAFRTGSLDLVWFGGLTGVQARLQTPGAQVLAQRDIDAAFHSVFIANIGSGLKPIDQQKELVKLKGRRFTFGSKSSTSGRLMPQYFLAEAGVKPSHFAGGTAGFSGSHDATIALVQSGSYEAGAVNEQVWKSNLASGKANGRKVEAIWRTPAYPDYHWVVRPDVNQRFGSGFSQRLQGAILAWRNSDPKQKQILDLFGARQFIRAKASEYKRIEQVGRASNMIR